MKCAVVAEVRIGGRQMLGVVVGSGGRRAVGIVHERTLQFVGNDTQFVAAHVQQRIHTGIDADRVGRGDEFAVGDRPSWCARVMIHCVLAAVISRPSHSTRVPRCAVALIWSRGVFGTQFGGMRAFTELCRSSRRGPSAGSSCPWCRRSQAGRSEGLGFAVEVDMTAAGVAARHDRGDAHVEIGVGLPLAVHSGKAVDETGDDELACAVDDLRAPLGMGMMTARTDIGDVAVLDDHDGSSADRARSGPSP